MQLFANLFVFLTFFVVPFLGGNHLPLYYISIDRFWIEGIFGLLLIISITFSFLRNKSAPSGFFKYLLFFLPLPALSVASLFYSWNFLDTLLWISILVWAIGSVYLYSISPKKEVCLIGLIVGAVFASISAILQIKILFPNLLATFQQGINAQILREQSGIPFASYMYHNILGGYLAFIFPLSLYFGIYKKSIFSLVAAVIIAVGVVITSTRIGLGITILMLLITAIILIFNQRKKDLFKVGLVGIIAVMSVWVVLHQMDRGHDVAGAKSIIIQKTKTISADLSTLNTRTDIWKNAFNAFRHSPVIGFGAGSFEYAYRKYFDGNSYTGVAHSTLVKIAVELGIAGLICFLFYVVGIGTVSQRLLREPRHLFIMLSLCVGFLFSLVDFSFDVKSHVLTFFLLSSVFFFSAKPYFKNTTNIKINGQGLGVFLTLALCLLVNLFFTTRLNEFKTSAQNGDLLVEEGLSLNALYQYRDAIETMPLSTEGFTRALSVLLQIYPVESRQKTKVEMAKEMKEYMSILESRGNKDSEVYFILGRGYALMGDTKKTDKYFSLALDYYPSSGYYVHEIAGYYASKANYEKAMEVIRSFDPFIEKHRGPHNPRGAVVYLIRDLEAEIHYRQGNGVEALRMAQNNLRDARNGVYMTLSTRSRYFACEHLIDNLRKKVEKYENDLVNRS
jgi:O-antigen ligase